MSTNPITYNLENLGLPEPHDGLKHYVNGASILPPFDNRLEVVALGMGCFWGAERALWKLDGVKVTAVGYGGGITNQANYRSVCSGETMHAELVLVVYDPSAVKFLDVLKVFWEAHDPTQGMRQGNDIGSQYRSIILTTTSLQHDAAKQTKDAYERHLQSQGFGPVTTEISELKAFHYAEVNHQQYLAKNPNGYCGLGGTGISCVI